MEKKVLKIGQISDTHIGADASCVQDIDVRKNFLTAYNADSMKNLDLLVISGDLADEESPEAYAYIAGILEDCKVPVCIIPGNHDKLEIMEKFFDLNGKVHNGRCYYRYDIAGRSIFFLDSADGTVSSDQLRWLEEETAKVEGEVLLFLHHPPCHCNHKFMDLRYAMKNIDEVQATLSKINNLKYIFVGHYHSEMVEKIGDKTVFVTPSTQMQIDPNSSVFCLSSAAPGWRVVEWGENFMETKVYFSNTP
ncbi:metallophosphoesterase [Fibrobacter sp. UBA4297]|uniref:metallophosphoesterase family protein n=1 Tax=Fibrobacter sp. UBA4297 TaxID=1946536 RepID=UPI0025BC4E03|nr:metallophosphoesterase [Fibrobacter sp. UBA4297]